MFMELLGFAPDARPTEQGVMTDCNMLIPTLRGFASMPSGVNAGITAGPSAVVSVLSIKNLDNTARLLAGTAGSASAATASLYEVNTSGWTNRDGASGPYTATGSMRWAFTTYNDTVLAAQPGTGMLKSIAANTDFTAITGAPNALALISVLDFVVAFNTNDATYGADPNRWRCCAAGDPDSWTADVATQANTGLLTDGNGGVIGAGTVGSTILALKSEIAYIGEYVGTPEVWAFRRVPGDGLGGWSHHSILEVEGMGVLWPGQDNFYVFDGTRAQPLPNDVAEYFLADLDISQAQRMVGYHDKSAWLTYWWYPSLSGGLGDGTLDKFVVYNYRSKRWGRGTLTVQFPFDYRAPGMTWGDLGSFYTTWADLPNAPYGQAFKTEGAVAPAYIDASQNILTLTGEGADSYYDTGLLGQDGRMTTSDRVRPRFCCLPLTAKARHMITDQAGETTISAQTVVAVRNMVDGAFDSVYEARWHWFRHSFTGNMEIQGLDMEGKPGSWE